jgi:folylpolyglutamate synthase/dihydropteroate synthase
MQMKRALTGQSFDELDNARKRLIAVLFSFLKDNDEKPTMQYVKAVACKAARIDAFNDIPLNQRKSLYRTFGAKNTRDWTEPERELIWSALRKENKN